MDTAGPETSCPKCGAPRIDGPECPRCGVFYAKAARRPLPAAAEVPAELLPLDDPPPASPPFDDEARFELRLRCFVLPAALVGAWLVMHAPVLRMLGRIFLSMWVHELGHAVTAWLCGISAFPGPWVTSVGESRSGMVSVLVLGACGLIAYRAWKERRGTILAIAAAAVSAHLLGSLGLRLETALAWVTFGGDAGCMVLGTLLMASFYAPRDSQIYQGALRWGFLVIGAVSFADVFETWWAARTDVDRIPFGQNEGVGLSDPSKLTDVYGWTIPQLIDRYVTLGLLCLLALAVVYALGLWSASRRGDVARPSSR